MGCDTSKSVVNILLSFETAYFKAEEITLKKSISSPISSLFNDASNNLISNSFCSEIKINFSRISLDRTSKLSLAEIGLYNNSILKVTLQSNTKTIKVLVKSSLQVKKEITVNKDQTVFDLKSKISKDITIKYSIILLKSVILPDHFLIKHLNIGNNEVLTFFSEEENKDIPYWRFKHPGFSREALCLNTECKAHRQKISISKGFGVFDIKKVLNSSEKCPVCGEALNKIFGVGLALCIFKVEYLENDEKKCFSDTIEDFCEVPNEWVEGIVDVKALNDYKC